MPRPQRPWFRFYVEAVHDRKLRRLDPEYRWLFVACCAAARQSCKPGHLLVGERDPMTLDDLVDFAAMPHEQVDKGMSALEQAGVVQVDRRTGAWFLPAWNDRQYESDDVTARTRKHRTKERSNDVPGNVREPDVGTPPETEAETETENPPDPPDRIDQIVDAVFAKVLVDKQRAGETIRSVDGLRSWWDENDGEGCRKRVAWLLENYDMPNVDMYATAARAPSMPQWSLSMRKDPAA